MTTLSVALLCVLLVNLKTHSQYKYHNFPSILMYITTSISWNLFATHKQPCSCILYVSCSGKFSQALKKTSAMKSLFSLFEDPVLYLGGELLLSVAKCKLKNRIYYPLLLMRNWECRFLCWTFLLINEAFFLWNLHFCFVKILVSVPDGKRKLA